MHIAIDAMGGDHAPEAIGEGALLAMEWHPGMKMTLLGDEARIRSCLGERGLPKGVAIEPTTQVIETGEAPLVAIRKKKDSSLMRGLTMVKEGQADGFVSAGSTGAVMAGALFGIGRIPGIHRPALAPLLPAKGKNTMLIDCGANADCKPEYLVQFGMMGSAYMQGVEGVKSPKVGLINIGAEEEKGSVLYRQVHQMLKQTTLHFVGNLEPRDVLMGQVDVIVADGFAGNMVLKSLEGTALFMMDLMKEEFFATTRNKVGALLLKPGLRNLKHRLDYTEIGGSALLGVQGCVIKAHGSSNPKAFSHAVDQAVSYVQNDVTAKIMEELAANAATPAQEK